MVLTRRAPLAQPPGLAWLLAGVSGRGREGLGRGLVDRVALIGTIKADPPDITFVAYLNRAHCPSSRPE